MVGDELVQPIVGCLGFPVAGNATQFVADRVLRAVGSDWRVVTSLVQPALLEEAIRGARAMRFAGLAFTESHQGAASRQMDELDVTAQRTGLIQVAKRIDESWIGSDLRGAVIARLVPEVWRSSSRILVLGDATLSDVVSDRRAIQRSQLELDGFEGPSDGMDSGLQREGGTGEGEVSDVEGGSVARVAACIVIGHPTSGMRAEMKGVEFERGARWIHFDSEQDRGVWKEWCEGRGLEFMDCREVEAMTFVEMFSFWTGGEIPLSMVREALDEYHGW